MVEVALDAGPTLDRGGDVRLPAQPRHEGVRTIMIALGHETSVRTDRHRKHRCTSSDIGKPPLQQRVDVDTLLLGIIFDGEQPRVQNRPQSTRLDGGGTKGSTLRR